MKPRLRRPRRQAIARLMERVAGWSSSTDPLEILRTGKLLAARYASHLGPRRRTAFAAALATVTVEVYWRAIQDHGRRAWPARSPWIEVDRGALSAQATWLATTLGRAAASVDVVTAGYFIGTTYAAALPSETRARRGVYYTPPALVTRLLDQVTAAGIDWTRCRVLDPACGGGAFLAPVAQRLVKCLSHLEPRQLLQVIADRVRGFEIDPVSGWISQVFLEAVVMPACSAAGRRLPPVVEIGDSLARSDSGPVYDLVVGNPPYGRVTLPTELRSRYAASLYGHANLYGLFTDLALRWVRPGGIVAFVTPTSFLAGEYFKNLRRLLGREAPPVAVDFIDQRKGVFDGVLQEAALATYRRGGRPRSTTVHRVTPLDESTMRVEPVGEFALPKAPDEPWLIPRDLPQAALMGRLRGMTHRLRDWGFAVSTGPLVWNRHRGQLCRKGNGGCLPVVWAEAVSSDGRFALRATKPKRQPFFKPRPSDAWLVTRHGCVLVQRTTAKEQSRRLIAAVLPGDLVEAHGGVVVENHVNMLRPKGAGSCIPLAALAAFLNSAVADQVFRCLSGTVAVSAYELEAMPLPPPEALSRLSEAVAAGAPRSDLDAIAASLYGLGSGSSD